MCMNEGQIFFNILENRVIQIIIIKQLYTEEPGITFFVLQALTLSFLQIQVQIMPHEIKVITLQTLLI